MKKIEIEVAVKTFYQALNQMFQGDASLMRTIWSEAEEATYLGPQGEIVQGFEKIMKNWEEQAKISLGGEVHVEIDHILMTDKMAIHQGWEVGTQVVDGKKEPVRIRVTNVFRKEGDQWKMLSHQTDQIPSLSKKKKIS